MMPIESKDNLLTENKPQDADDQSGTSGKSERPRRAMGADNQPTERDDRVDGENKQRHSYIKYLFNDTKITDWALAIFTLVLAFYTAELARVASKQTKVLQNTDIAIHETSKAANDANKLNAAGLRPWVSAQPTVGTDFIYDANGARISVLLKLSNSGKLPAQQINVHLLASAVFSSKIDACSLPPSPIGSILFPDHSNIHPVVTSIADDEIAKANTGRPRAEWLINPKVSVCIYYKSNLDDTTHRTRYSVHYRMAANKIKPERECCSIFVDDGRISADNLDVGIDPLADDFAD